MKKVLLSCVCVLALAACQTARPMGQKSAADTPMDVPAKSIDATVADAKQPIVPNDPGVAVYDLGGPMVNPLVTNRTHSVLDNTTSGGYTVFDDSVTVYPLPGESAPAYMPTYAVPPLQAQYKPQAPMVGQQPMGLASAGMLPPVKNVDVGEADPYAKPPVPGAVRKPLTLTAPQPLTLQAPSAARPPMASPFQGGSLTAAEPTPTPPQATTSASMTEGRKSGPMLTGY